MVADFYEVDVRTIERYLETNKEELERKVKTFISGYILHYDDIESVNLDIQSDIIELNEPIDNMINIYKELNILELNKLINALKFTNISTLIIKPFQDKKID